MNMSNPASVTWWQNRLYPRPECRNPVTQFVRELEARVRPEHTVLDVGAGAGLINTYNIKGRCARLVGIDMDPRVISNPQLDEGLVRDAAKTGLPDNTFDLVFSIYVLEHIERPQEFVGEMHRILKPGGLMMFLTPNRHHYVPLISRATGSGFHKWFNSLRGRDHSDTFPTFYRLNTRSQLRRIYEAQGMELVSFKMIEVQPNYLTWSLPTFLCGAAYERVVNATNALSGVRVNIIGVFRKL